MSSGSQHLESTGFAELGLDPRMVAVLRDLDYAQPTPIQMAAIPVVLSGRDLVGQAATGTGKTAAFALPMLHRIAAQKSQSSRSRAPSGLVLAPTRELAMQVAEAAQTYGKALGLKVLPIYGGQGYGEQLRGLSQGVDVVVATPGRALDHVRRGTLVLSSVKTVVLDEADEMLDMGFADEIETLLQALPVERQVLLFSATMPPRIADVAKRHQTNPEHISIKPEKPAQGTAPRVREVAYVVTRAQKVPALKRILEVEKPVSAIIFCRTRENVDELTEALVGSGHSAEALHGGMSQVQRERVVRRLKDGKTQLVIATDVAARGLDIDQLSHVINTDVPGQVEAYVHRIGRVGRAGREGVAMTLLEPRDHRLFRLIEKTTGRSIAVAKIPTQEELSKKRFDMTADALRACLESVELDSFTQVLDRLHGDVDMVRLTLAAIKLVHEGLHQSQDEAGEIISPKLPTDRSSGRFGKDSSHRKQDDRKPGKKSFHKNGEQGPEATLRGGRPGRGPSSRRTGQDRSPHGDVVCVKVNVGRSMGIRPGDLVGAITGEAGVPGRAIGAIQITDDHSLVEVPGSMASDIVAALGRARIKGRKIQAQRMGHH